MTDTGTDRGDKDRVASGVSLGGALGAVFAVLGFVIGSRPISDNSFLTHLATGRLILDGNAIPRVDPFSWPAQGEPWTVQSWLASFTYSVLYEYGGGWSLRILNGALVAALAYSMWRLSGAASQVLPRVALVGTAVVVGSLVWSPRPLLFGLLAFALVLLVMQRQLPVWTLIPVMWVWVNTHGSFPIALIAIGAIALGEAIDRRNVPRYELRVLAWATVGTMAGAISPLGPRLLWFPVELLSRSDALRRVGEWQAPTFANPRELAFLLLIGALVVAAARGARARALLPGFLFVVAGLLAVRNLGLASIVLLVAAAPWLDMQQATLDGSSRGAVPNALMALSVVAFVFVGFIAVQDGALDLEEYPETQVDWLEERGLVASPDIRLIQRPLVGNYLEFRYGSEAWVFMDDRFDFYPQDVIDDLETLIFGGDYREVLERREADVVLWANEGGFASWLREADDWFVAVGDDDWFAACRVDSVAAAPCAS